MIAPAVARLARGPIEVEVLPDVGARLHRLRAFGVDLLRTPADLALHAAEPVFWGGYVMAPWCNRLATGPVVVGGRTVDLAPNFADGSAIHGLVATAGWRRRGEGAFAIRRPSGAGWPWAFEVAEIVVPTETGLRVGLRLANRDPAPMPAGIGLHPWFRRPLELSVPAADVLRSNVDPSATPTTVAGGPFDLRHRSVVPDGLDATWLDLADPAVELAWPTLGLAASMRIRGAGPWHVAVATPASLGAAAVEPESHVPQGLRRLLAGDPLGLSWLAPGASLSMELELSIRRLG